VSPAEATMDWVRDFVIAHALCPFAARPFAEGGVVAEALPETDFEDAYYAALTRVQEMLEGKGGVETLLLVFSNALVDFEDFLDFVYALEEGLTRSGLDAQLQLAHFHPDYRFAGVPPDDPGNRTNRAPFPVVQLLRVDSVAAAVAAYPDVEAIPERNVARMRKVFG